ncbi:MAG TPA: hypothetical protein VI564_02830 [Candidatus Nanoarchaeia archaeon]|nr:hypothetical protein [Candidatus Nanoarchaeia archaeon]
MVKRRIQLDISDAGLKELLNLKNQLYATTMADAIRSSLKIVKKLEEEKKKGNKIVIVDKDNNQREIEFI